MKRTISFRRTLNKMDNNLTEKKCSKCKTEKSLKEFSVDKRHKDGKSSWCKKCSSLSSAKCHKIRYLNGYRKPNSEKRKEVQLQWEKNNIEKVKEYKIRWAIKNPDKIKVTSQKSGKKIRGTTKGKLNRNLSLGIYRSLKDNKNNRHWEELVGFTADQLKKHLEKHFNPGMTWENYGTYWHIDHKIPIAVFNFIKPGDLDFRRCWALGNLQPLEAIDNIKKGAKINAPFQPSLLI